MQFGKYHELNIAINKWVLSIEIFFIPFGEILSELCMNEYLGGKQVELKALNM